MTQMPPCSPARAAEGRATRAQAPGTGPAAPPVRFTPTGQVLDFGAGTGLLCAHIAPRVARVLAVDVVVASGACSTPDAMRSLAWDASSGDRSG